MKLHIILILSFIVVLSSAVPQEKKKVCEPGSVFKVVCNTCRCNTDGMDMACTRKECPPGFDTALQDAAAETESGVRNKRQESPSY